MNKKMTVVLLLMLLSISSSLFAETIVLKSGKTVEGRIIEKTKDHIKIDVSGIPITYYSDEIVNIDNTPSSNSLPSNGQAVETSQSDSQKQKTDNTALKITINPMVELDFKSKDEIYAIRKEAVSRYAELAPKDYAPLGAIFGQIENNKPWWGMVGQSFFGPGEKSIVGPSEESRFLMNPFLLVGLTDINAYIIDDKNLTPQGNYPVPSNLIWNKGNSTATVTYEVTNYWKVGKRYHYQSADTHTFELIAYNARDLGFNYLYIVPDKSKNILSSSGGLVLLGQYIHCGGSCGYPGGCNNMSPEQRELQIKVDQTPATLYMKLWKNKPSGSEQAADMIFVIEMI